MPVPEPMPGYGQLLRRGYGSLAGAVRGCGDCGWELARRSWAENAHLGWAELLLCGLCALGWTALRRTAARWVFRVSAGPPRGNGAPAGCGMGTPGTGWMRDGGGGMWDRDTGDRRDGDTGGGRPCGMEAPGSGGMRHPLHRRGHFSAIHARIPRAGCAEKDVRLPPGLRAGGDMAGETPLSTGLRAGM